jgi:transcriptional regulator with XRE-family HTH domain
LYDAQYDLKIQQENIMQEKSTSFHTILRILLRELRQNSNVQQAQIGQLLGKSASTWSKVETGETELTLDHVLTVCHACQVLPSVLLQTAQNYMSVFTQFGWYVAGHGKALEKTEDKLALEADNFYAFVARPIRPVIYGNTIPVLATPWPYLNQYSPIDVFRWATDEVWKNGLLQTPIIPPPPPYTTLPELPGNF